MSQAHASDWTKTRSKIATTLRYDPAADVTDLRRELRAQRLEEHVQKVIDAAPPLTDEQRDRIARILQGGGRR